MQNKGMYIVVFIAVVVILAVRIFLSSQQTETADELRGTVESLQATIDAQASQIASGNSTGRITEVPRIIVTSNAAIQYVSSTSDSDVSTATEIPELVNPPTETDAAIEVLILTSDAKSSTATEIPQLDMTTTESNVGIRYTSPTPEPDAATPIRVLQPTSPVDDEENSIFQHVETSDFLVNTIDFISSEFTISPDSREIVGSDASNQIFIANLSTGEVRQLGQAQGTVTAIDWSPDGKFIAVADLNNNLTVFDVETGEEVYSYRSSVYIDDLAWSPNNEYLAGIGENQVFAWSYPRFVLLKNQSVDTPSSNQSLSWQNTPDIFNITASDSVRVITMGQEVTNMKGFSLNTKGATFVAVSPNNKFFATASNNYKRIRIHQSGSGQVIDTFDGHQGDVLHISWSPNGNYLASASSDNTVRVWDTETGELLYVLEHEITVSSVKWSPDGSYLASSAIGVRLWDLPLDASPDDD